MDIPTAEQMIVNISNNIPMLIGLATGVIYLFGMYIIATSVAAMRNAPILGPVSQGQKTMTALFKQILVGAAMLYFPSTISVGTSTLFNTPMPYAYIANNTGDYTQIYHAIFLLLELVGVIAVGKGIYELGFGEGSNSQETGKHSAFHKGLMHIIGGILCLNMQATVQVIFATLGFTGIFNN